MNNGRIESDVIWSHASKNSRSIRQLIALILAVRCEFEFLEGNANNGMFVSGLSVFQNQVALNWSLDSMYH